MSENFQAEVPSHNPNCEGCLQRALTQLNMAEVLSELVEQGKSHTRLLENLVEQGKDISEIKSTVASLNTRLVSMERDIYGDKEREEEGLKRKVMALHDVMVMVIGNRWIVGVFGTSIIALVWFTVKHLIEEGVFK